jgi:hypothetical protein
MHRSGYVPVSMFSFAGLPSSRVHGLVHFLRPAIASLLSVRLTNTVRCEAVRGVRICGGRYHYPFLVQSNSVER